MNGLDITLAFGFLVLLAVLISLRNWSRAIQHGAWCHRCKEPATHIHTWRDPQTPRWNFALRCVEHAKEEPQYIPLWEAPGVQESFWGWSVNVHQPPEAK